MARAWTRFILLFLGVFAALTMAAVAVAFVLDPYDTGRPGWINKAGVRPQGPRTAAASRGRDPAFNAAIFGNSHVQLLSPERLNALTGLSFVSLIAPATLHREQLVLLDWFRRHRTTPPKAIVLGIDGNWCTGDPNPSNDKPFPYWLYERSLPSYLRGLIRYDMLEEAPRRLAYLFAKNPTRARPDGYWDYEPNYTAMGYDVRPQLRTAVDWPDGDVMPNLTGTFPAAEQLATQLRDLPPQTQVILLHTPVYLPAGTRENPASRGVARRCKAAFADVARQRPNTTVIDWRLLGPDQQDTTLWFDNTHYRKPIALRIEQDIGRVLKPQP